MHCVQNSDPLKKKVHKIEDMSKHDRSLHTVRFDVVLNDGSKKRMPACKIDEENPQALPKFFAERPEKRRRYDQLAAKASIDK